VFEELTNASADIEQERLKRLARYVFPARRHHRRNKSILMWIHHMRRTSLWTDDGPLTRKTRSKFRRCPGTLICCKWQHPSFWRISGETIGRMNDPSFWLTPVRQQKNSASCETREAESDWSGTELARISGDVGGRIVV